MRKEYITEAFWGKIFEFLKTIKQIYIGQEKKCKKFIAAVLWMLRSGSQWRLLPGEYGCWNSIFKRYNAWSKKGVFMQLFTLSIIDPDTEYVMIDATIIRAHACSAGYKKKSVEGLGRSVGGFTTKINVISDALGNPLRFNVTPGQCHDVTQASALLKGLAGKYFIADRGYVSEDLRAQIIAQGFIPVIPPKSNSKEPHEYDKEIYKERHVIECFFSKVKYFRRIAMRYDKAVRSFESFFALACVCLWLR